MSQSLIAVDLNLQLAEMIESREKSYRERAVKDEIKALETQLSTAKKESAKIAKAKESIRVIEGDNAHSLNSEKVQKKIKLQESKIAEAECTITTAISSALTIACKYPDLDIIIESGTLDCKPDVSYKKVIASHEEELYNARYGSTTSLLKGLIERMPEVQVLTHSDKMSHPSASSTGVVFYGKKENDGLVRSGNVDELIVDAYSNASANADVWEFLNMTLNGVMIHEHITNSTKDIHELLSVIGDSEDILSKIKFDSDGTDDTNKYHKQVYFPLGNGEYHLLTPIVNSPMLLEMRNRIRKVREDDRGFIPDMIGMKFGGANPQNVSHIANKHGRFEFLMLNSTPPVFKKQDVKKPKKSFFDLIWEGAFEDDFSKVSGLIRLNNDRLLATATAPKSSIMTGFDSALDRYLDKVFFHSENLKCLNGGWSNETNLPEHQKMWLDTSIERDDSFKELVLNDVMSWYKNAFNSFAKHKELTSRLTDFEMQMLEKKFKKLENFL